MKLLRLYQMRACWGMLLLLLLSACATGTQETGTNASPSAPVSTSSSVAASPSAQATVPSEPQTTPDPQPSSTDIVSTGVADAGCPTIAFFRAPDPADQTFTADDADKQFTIATNKLLEFRLSKKMNWSVNLNPNIYKMAAESGYASGDLCIFRYYTQAQGAGNMIFTGRPICLAGQLCPLYVQEVTFKLTIK